MEKYHLQGNLPFFRIMIRIRIGIKKFNKYIKVFGYEEMVLKLRTTAAFAEDGVQVPAHM